MNIGQVKDSLRWAERLVAEGETHNSDSMWTAGNWAISFAEFFHGNFTRSLHHAELILTGYESKKLRPIPELQNVDGKVNALSFKARALWCLGFPNQARRAAAESVTWAEHLGSPTNICFARLQAAWTSHLVRDPDEVELHTQAMARVAQEFGLVFYARVFAPIQTGLALAIRGKAAAAVLHLQSALRVFQDAGSELSVPVIRGALGEALGAIGKVNEGLEEVAQAIAQIERQGWEERQHYADILITKGSLLRLKHDRDGAEASYREAIDIARQQQAKSFELRATTALARLRQHASRREEGRKLLTAVYSWFTEGFDTQDLKDAKALLDELT